MSARGLRAPLICSALLGTLMISCGGPPIYVVVPTPPAAPAPGALTAPEAGTAPEPQGGLAQAQQPAPAAEPPPLPKAAPPQAPAQKEPDSGPTHWRARGAPPGVKFELPTIGSDYNQESAWKKKLYENCHHTVGTGGDCPKFDYRFYKRNSQGGKGSSISDLKSNYEDSGKYESCEVSRMNPMSGKGKYVEAGSTIIIEILCTPVEPDGLTPPEDQSDHSKDHHGKDQSDHNKDQPGHNKDRSGTPDGTGG
jgi:hypothetical protein